MALAIGSSPTYRSPAFHVSPKPIEKITLDVWSIVLSYLKPCQAGEFRLTSKNINALVIQAFNDSTDRSIRAFIEALIDKSKKSEAAVEDLTPLTAIQYAHLLDPSPASLREIKKNTILIREYLCPTIKRLLSKDPSLLEGIELPRFMHHIPDLLRLEKDIEKNIDFINANAFVPGRIMPCTKLHDIAIDLAKIWALNRALKVAESIPAENVRVNALERISIVLAQAGECDRALEVAQWISEKGDRAWLLRHISKALAETGEIDRALKVAELIHEKEAEQWALQDISAVLAKAGKLNRALKIVQSISKQAGKDNALRDSDKLYQAFRVSQTSSPLAIEGDATLDVITAFVHAGRFDEVLQLVDHFTGERRESSISCIAYGLIQADEIGRALKEVSERITGREFREGMLTGFALRLIREGKVDKAREIVRHCPHVRLAETFGRTCLVVLDGSRHVVLG